MKNILIVDDSKVARSMLRRALASAGFSDDCITEASDGFEALERIAEAAPDLVLSDLNMPGLDGEGLLRAIAADASIVGLPVVMITSRAGVEATSHLVRLGATAVIAKPFQPETLFATIMAAIEGKSGAPSEHASAFDDDGLVAAVASSLETMAFFDVVATPVEASDESLFVAEIDFASGWRIGVATGAAVAAEIASRLLGVDEVTTRIRCDAIAEMCNVVAGRLASAAGWTGSAATFGSPRWQMALPAAEFDANHAFTLDGDGVLLVRYARISS